MASPVQAEARRGHGDGDSQTLRARPAAKRLPHRAFLLLLGAYLATGLWMAYRMPAFSGPNEELHYEFIAHLRRDLALPDPSASGRMDERHQPPIYYLSAALAGWRHPHPLLDTDLPGNPYYLATPSGNLNPKLHADPQRLPLLYSARLTSLFFGLLGLLATYWAALRLASPQVAVLIAALLAFNPAWLHLSSVAANDLPAAAMSAIALALATWILCREAGSDPRAGAGQGESLDDAPVDAPIDAPIDAPVDAPPRDSMGRRSHPHPTPWRDSVRQARPYLLWGFLFSLAVLTKANAIFLALALAVLCLDRWRRAGLPNALLSGLAAVLGFLPPLLAWLAFNASRGLYGTGVERSVPLAALRTLRPADIRHLLPELGRIWRSVWLDWSRGEVGYAPDLVYWLIGLLGLAAVAGWCFGRPRLLRFGRSDSGTEARSMTPTAFAMHFGWTLGFLAFYLAVKTLMIRDAGFLTPEGRWLLPLAPSLAWLCGMGLARRWPEGALRDRLARRLAAAVTLAGLGLALWLVPWLYPTARLVDRVAAGATLPAGAILFDRAIALESASTRTESVPFGRALKVELRWRALRDLDRDYEFALSDPFDPGRNLHSHPGLGMAPTKGWLAGEVRVDGVSLAASTDSAIAPPIFPELRSLRIDLLDASRTLPASRADGGPVSNPALFDVAILPPRQMGLAELLRATGSTEQTRWLDPAPQFAEQIELLAVGLTGGESDARSQESQAGEFSASPSVSLWWHALAPTDRDLVVFVHVLDAEGKLLGQADAEPALPPDGAIRSPSSIWRAGDIVASWHSLGEICAGGDCARLLVGWYERGKGLRLEVEEEGARLPDDAYRFDMKRPAP